jgi:hypothetical protein
MRRIGEIKPVCATVVDIKRLLLRGRPSCRLRYWPTAAVLGSGINFYCFDHVADP